MAGSLDTAFKNAAKSIVSSLGSALDTKITYTYNTARTYNVNTGSVGFTSTVYGDITAPVEYVKSNEEQTGAEAREAKVYITPNLIGNNQPSFRDEVTITYDGGSKVCQIIDIDTFKGGQTYLYVLKLKF